MVDFHFSLVFWIFSHGNSEIVQPSIEIHLMHSVNSHYEIQPEGPVQQITYATETDSASLRLIRTDEPMEEPVKERLLSNHVIGMMLDNKFGVSYGLLIFVSHDDLLDDILRVCCFLFCLMPIITLKEERVDGVPVDFCRLIIMISEQPHAICNTF